MPTQFFNTREEAEAFAATIIGAWVAQGPSRIGWMVVWPG